MRRGVSRERHERAMAALSRCRLCPRRCGTDRRSGRTGFCGAGAIPRVAAVSVHHGEEPPISGSRGSGTVFFSHCNMKCLFCQNYPISQLGVGETMTTEELCRRILRLERKRVHNIHFVTPTPHIPQLIDAVASARANGLTLPVVYNTNGYETRESLGLLEGTVDIYLPDMKYRSDDLASAASDTPDYSVRTEQSIAEMVRQVGPLRIGEDGIAIRGVLIRHLVLPGRLDETERVLSFIRETFGPGMPLSLMGQYFPAYRAASFRAIGKRKALSDAPLPHFGRKVSRQEYDRAVDRAVRLGLETVYIQDLGESPAMAR